MLVDEGVVVIRTVALNYAIDFIRNEYDPEEIFSETQLEKWANANGYVKGGDNDV